MHVRGLLAHFLAFVSAASAPQSRSDPRTASEKVRSRWVALHGAGRSSRAEVNLPHFLERRGSWLLWCL